MSKKEKNNNKVHILYCILYESISDRIFVNSLCYEIKKLNFINAEQNELLLKHFKSQKPNFFRHRSFYYNNIFTGRAYWWYNYNVEKSTEQRKLFIKTLVDKTSPAKTNLIDII